VTEYSILIVDANPDMIQQLSGILRANGFQVAATSSGDDALGIYKKDSPDLVLVNQELVDMDGLQLLSNLKSFDPKAMVVATAATADKDTIARAFRLGAVEFLEKPLESQFLVSKLRDLLAREDRALEGDLKMMSLASIIQINCEERNQAQLILNFQGEEGQIYFKDGELIHAESQNQTGEEAVYELLSWEDGSFRLRMGAKPSNRTIHKAWSGLLLEGMRRIDESTADWSPERDLEPEDQIQDTKEGQIQARIVKAVSSISEVKSALLFSPKGTVIAQEKCDDPEREMALGEYILAEAELISGFMDGGAMERIVLSGSEHRLFLMPQSENTLILRLAKRSSAETVFESVQTIYKRYRTA
jgi:CheY-like chemotaxis protein/predicted regulator of Ras-like GTPase activity (Roadblock/LC7/MglB family)